MRTRKNHNGNYRLWNFTKNISPMHKWIFIIKKSIVLLLLVFFCYGCVKQAVLAPDSLTAKTLSVISGAVSETDILSTVAQIDLVTPRGHYPARAALVLKKQLYLRLELLPIIGPPDFFLSVTPEDMKILLPEKHEFYYGAPTAHNFSQFLPWPFAVKDIVAILTNSYPTLNGEVSYQSYVDGDVLRIEMKARSGNSQIVWVGSNNRLIKVVRIDQFGRELYTAKFDEYEEGSPIAGKISVIMADGVTSISVKYSDCKIEKAVDLSIFALPVPAGFKTIKLD